MKSKAEHKIEKEIIKMESLIQNQKVKIEDAQQLIEMACNILEKCVELRNSRGKWRIRAEKAESKLKDLNQ